MVSISFTAKITDSSGVEHNYNLLRNMGSPCIVYGFWFDDNGLYAQVDTTRAYIVTK